MSGDHPNYGIIEIGQNTEKSPRVLRRLGVTQTPEENHQLTLGWKLSNYSRQNSIAEIISKELISGLYLSLDIPDPFSSRPETNLNKWTKEQEN